jgi:glycolate oxidase iron-sulfur subunit
VQTHLSPEFKDTPEGEEGEAILRKCVHCGFCNATCPTYQLLGDELDGPRGRIYLIKQVLEGAPVTRSTQQHLDRCLTCRNCETTCPSGVEYGHLVDIGRQIVERKTLRPAPERAARWLLREGLTSRLFAPAVRVGQALRALLPRIIANKVPPRAAARAHAPSSREHRRKVLLLAGCVQPALMPNINGATQRVLDAAGIQTVVSPGAGCCGAVRQHLGDRDGALADMRRNIDAWWPLIESAEVEAIVSNASGCSIALKDYGHAFERDAAYAQKAASISAKARDLCELLPELVAALKDKVGDGRASPVALHVPCTLQHGQRLGGEVRAQLRALGFGMQAACNESHLCCGSAGTYSVLQPALAYQLRDRKLANLSALGPQSIVSANIGCIQHLQTGTSIPVKHWVEMLDEAILT